MKHKNLKALLCTSALAIVILGAVLPGQGDTPVPPEPTNTQAPAETDPPTDNGGVMPLSDLKGQKSE